LDFISSFAVVVLKKLENVELSTGRRPLILAKWYKTAETISLAAFGKNESLAFLSLSAKSAFAISITFSSILPSSSISFIIVNAD
jgi:hypothetical protein